MFYSANISVDPSQLTKIEKVKPKKVFKRILFQLTSGKIADKEEQETFTAISILQQFFQVFKSLNIDNIVRISHDSEDIYFDKKGKKSDIKEAMDTYDAKVNSSMSHAFKKLYLVLEHDLDNFHYFIEIDINRNHEVGVYPIEIKINGLLKEFKTKQKNSGFLRTKMLQKFSKQKDYDLFLLERKTEFQVFVDSIVKQIDNQIHIDDVKTDVKINLIAPKEKTNKYFKPKLRSSNSSNYEYGATYYEPIFYDYYDLEDQIFYSYMWSSVLYENNIEIDNVHVYSDTGDNIGEIIDPINANTIDILNDKVSYETETATLIDTTSIETNSSVDNHSDSDSSSDSSSGSSWFSFDSWGSSDSSSSWSSCGSSCSSCSSCGGGCGGD